MSQELPLGADYHPGELYSTNRITDKSAGTDGMITYQRDDMILQLRVKVRHPRSDLVEMISVRYLIRAVGWAGFRRRRARSWRRPGRPASGRIGVGRAVVELSSRDRRGPFPKRWLKRTGSPLPDADSEPEVRAWILEQIGPDDVERRNAVGVHASRRRALQIRRRDMS